MDLDLALYILCALLPRFFVRNISLFLSSWKQEAIVKLRIWIYGALSIMCSSALFFVRIIVVKGHQSRTGCAALTFVFSMLVTCLYFCGPFSMGPWTRDVYYYSRPCFGSSFPVGLTLIFLTFFLSSLIMMLTIVIMYICHTASLILCLLDMPESHIVSFCKSILFGSLLQYHGR